MLRYYIISQKILIIYFCFDNERSSVYLENNYEQRLFCLLKRERYLSIETELYLVVANHEQNGANYIY